MYLSSFPRLIGRALVVIAALTAMWLPPTASAASESERLPAVEETHYFEFYTCGKQTAAIIITPTQAVIVRGRGLDNFRTRLGLEMARVKAMKQGTAYEARGTDGTCTEI